MSTDLNIYGASIRDVQLQKANAEYEYHKLLMELHQSDLYLKVAEAELKVKEFEKTEAELKDSILNGMRENNLKSLEFTNQKFTVKQNPASVVIKDESLIPAEYKKEKTTVTVDKTAVKNALKEGNTIDGAELSYSYSLVISPK